MSPVSGKAKFNQRKYLGYNINDLQKVQRRLLAEETVSKADKSPVTVADYGIHTIWYGVVVRNNTQ